MPKRFHYGGQAVLEGVMMRGPKTVKVSVRKPDGEIVSRTEPLNSLLTGRLRKIPLLRGIVALVETMILGMRSLMFSAKISAEEELEGELKPAYLWSTVIFGIVAGVGLFVALPMLITHYGVDRYITSSMLSNLADGVIRVLIFITYLLFMNLLPDVRRVFAFHGAEHKTINAYEAGVPMEVEAIQKYSTAHTRCGTSFLLIVLAVSIIVFVFTGQPAVWLRMLSRLALMPVIAAIGYEVIHFAADHTHNILVKTIMSPGLALQALTTRESDDQQVEVAIDALLGVLESEEGEST